MPRPWMGWHLADMGHPPLGYMPLGSQMSAHCDGAGEPGVWSTHWPSAVASRYLSAGQGLLGEHSGEQKEPERPWMDTFCLSLIHI